MDTKPNIEVEVAIPSLHPEPRYDLEVANQFVLFSTVRTFGDWLRRHKSEFPARYRRLKTGRKRIVTASEIIRIQEIREKAASYGKV